MVQLSHPYMTIGKIIALTIWIFVGKVISLLFNMLSRFVIAFLPRNKCLLISWLQEIINRPVGSWLPGLGKPRGGMRTLGIKLSLPQPTLCVGFFLPWNSLPWGKL